MKRLLKGGESRRLRLPSFAGGTSTSLVCGVRVTRRKVHGTPAAAGSVDAGSREKPAIRREDRETKLPEAVA